MPSDIAPPPDAIPKIVSDLQPSADGGSFAIYRDNSAPMTVIGLPAGASAADFWFKAQSYQLPDGLIFRASAAAQVMHRGAVQIALGDDKFLIQALVAGQVRGRCADRPLSVDAGDIAIYDNARGYDTQTSDYDIMALFIARERVPPLLEAPAVHGAVIPGASGAGRLLYRTFETLFETIEALTLAEANAAVDALIGMLAAALRPVIARDNAHLSGNPMVDKALAYIDAHIADVDLAPARLEEQLAMSRSALYRMFEPLGGVRAMILRRRLELCMKEILAGIAATELPRSLGQEHGFRSETHFNRAFRARFGVSPRAFHDMVRRKDHAALLAQAQHAGLTSFQAWIDHRWRTNEAN